MRTEVSTPLRGRRLLVAVSGSIAAVKTPLLVSGLVKAGAEVRCLVTPSAARLVSPLALATLSRHRCYQEDDEWDSSCSRPLHIELAALGVTRQRTSAPAFTRPLTSKGVFTAAMLPLTATRSLRPLRGVETSVLIKRFLIHQVDVGGCQIGAVDRQGPEQVPVRQPCKRGRVVILIQSPRQLGDGRLIKLRQALGGDRGG